jgi:hypothetical protein
MTDLTKEICSCLFLCLNNMVNMHVKLPEDNVGTLILGRHKQRKDNTAIKALRSQISLVLQAHWFLWSWACKNSIRGPTRRPIHQRSWHISFHKIAKAAHGMVTSHTLF